MSADRSTSASNSTILNIARSSTVTGHVGHPVTLRFDIDNRGSVPASYTVTLDADTPELSTAEVEVHLVP
jgi:hypothetical protein